MRVSIEPSVIRWARERAGKSPTDLGKKFNPAWESGEKQPTLKQLETFAKAVNVSLGYLLLSEPPHEELPISDFRTLDNRSVDRPSPDLLDTLYLCQERQEWYREFAAKTDLPKCAFVGSASPDTPIEITARHIRDTLGFDPTTQKQHRTWEEAFRDLIRLSEQSGILVMVNGIVGGNAKRKLEPDEFRGFALADPYAPLIFINGADSKAAQMFTLAHELAHVWLGESGLSDTTVAPIAEVKSEESYCNAVAAEMLVPLDHFRAQLREETVEDALDRLPREFKVSSLVILRRLLDARWLSREEFNGAWTEERRHIREKIESERKKRKEKGGGGDFFRSALLRTGERFTQALTVSALEGSTLYRDACDLLGVNKVKTLHKLYNETLSRTAQIRK